MPAGRRVLRFDMYAWHVLVCPACVVLLSLEISLRFFNFLFFLVSLVRRFVIPFVQGICHPKPEVGRACCDALHFCFTLPWCDCLQFSCNLHHRCVLLYPTISYIWYFRCGSRVVHGISIYVIRHSALGIRPSRVIEMCKSGGFEITTLMYIQPVMGSILSENPRIMESFQVAA